MCNLLHGLTPHLFSYLLTFHHELHVGISELNMISLYALIVSLRMFNLFASSNNEILIPYIIL